LTELQKKKIRANLRQMTPEQREKLKLETIAFLDGIGRRRHRRSKAVHQVEEASKQERLLRREELIRTLKAMTPQERAGVRKETNRLIREAEPHRFLPPYLQIVK
jgi:hypothetical protein